MARINHDNADIMGHSGNKINTATTIGSVAWTKKKSLFWMVQAVARLMVLCACAQVTKRFTSKNHPPGQ